MIYNYSSILFVSISLIFYFSIGLANELKLFIESRNSVYKCSTDAYLIIRNWTMFDSLNISCPNENSLSIQSLNIFYYRLSGFNCTTETKSFSMQFFLTQVSSVLGKDNDQITDEQLKLMSSTVILGNHTYPFTPTRTGNPGEIFIYEIPLQWTDNRQHTWYMLMQEQPIACIFELHFDAFIVNETCVQNTTIKNRVMCYHDPSSSSPLQNVDWNELNDFVYSDKYLPNNWYEKGGNLYNKPSPATTTTTTITTTTTKKTTKTKIKSITTTPIKNREVSAPKPRKPKAPSKKHPKIKTAQSQSTVSGKPTSKKKSSSPPMLLIFLLVIFICAIIGLGIFFIIRRSRKQQSNNGPTALDRVASDESNYSEMDELETATVTETSPQPRKEQVLTKKAGRMINRFDPNTV